jgi:hypothetical protein
MSGDSSVGIATVYELDDRIWFPVGASFFSSLLHGVQTGCQDHPVSYPMATGNSFPGGKAAGP